MKASNTKNGFLCLLSQVLYALVLVLLFFLRMKWKIPLVSEIIALIGMGVAFLWPMVSFITSAASLVFQILALKKKESIVSNVLMMIVTIILIALAVLFAKGAMRNMFYG